MQAYKVFIKERLPVIPNFILAFGLMLSAAALTGESARLFPTVFGALALFLFVSELRFMDEIKDVEKDIIANPDRPLPRGAIEQKQVGLLITGSGALLCLFAAVSAAIFTPTSGALLGVSIIWLYLMYKEFFVGDWLSSRPLLYAITHQIVIFPLCLFAVSLYEPAAALEPAAFAFGALILSAFFSFEVGRKLDPSSHEILKTYLFQYGPKVVIAFLICLQTLAAASAFLLGAFWWVAVPAILILISLPKLLSAPREFKKLEGLISLNLIYIVWVLAIKGLTELL